MVVLEYALVFLQLVLLVHGASPLFKSAEHESASLRFLQSGSATEVFLVHGQSTFLSPSALETPAIQLPASSNATLKYVVFTGLNDVASPTYTLPSFVINSGNIQGGTFTIRATTTCANSAPTIPAFGIPINWLILRNGEFYIDDGINHNYVFGSSRRARVTFADPVDTSHVVFNTAPVVVVQAQNVASGNTPLTFSLRTLFVSNTQVDIEAVGPSVPTDLIVGYVAMAPGKTLSFDGNTALAARSTSFTTGAAEIAETELSQCGRMRVFGSLGTVSSTTAQQQISVYNDAATTATRASPLSSASPRARNPACTSSSLVIPTDPYNFNSISLIDSTEFNLIDAHSQATPPAVDASGNSTTIVWLCFLAIGIVAILCLVLFVCCRRPAAAPAQQQQQQQYQGFGGEQGGDQPFNLPPSPSAPYGLPFAGGQVGQPPPPSFNPRAY